MKRISAFLLFCLLLTRGFAAWYWPFGSDDAKKPPRMSELMEEASIMIDDAADLANQGEITEAVEKYKEAFAELERIELENPVRAATSEFSTVRNKKAYISAAIDSLLLNQASDNVRAVSVTDTSEIEKKYAGAKAENRIGKIRKRGIGRYASGVEKNCSEEARESAKKVTRCRFQERSIQEGSC